MSFFKKILGARSSKREKKEDIQHAELFDEHGRPTGNASRINLQEFMILNTKYVVAAMADLLSKNIKSMPQPIAPPIVSLHSQLMNQKDFHTEWFRYWIAQLDVPIVFFRKWWEFCFVLHGLFENGMIVEGKRGLGLGCGEEALASFLISKGCKVTAGDQPQSGESVDAWSQTSQHTKSADSLYKPQYLSRELFDRNFTLAYIDMNELPVDHFGMYDFCWSVCVVEHLGSIENGINFLKNSLKLLKPGGISIHTTEFNYLNTEKTVDNGGVVAYKREHFEVLASEIEKEGGSVLPLDFSVGDDFLDKYIDLPPFWHHNIPGIDYPASSLLDTNTVHLRLWFEGVPITNFGIILQKNT